MDELVNQLPELTDVAERRLSDAIDTDSEPEHVTGAALRALRRFLDGKDPDHIWGGLQPILTPEDHYLWLCQDHAKEYLV